MSKPSTMTLKTITNRQRQVFDAIVAIRDRDGASPTHQELADHFSITFQAIQQHLASLVKAGYLKTDRKRASRNLIPTTEARAQRLLPELRAFVARAAKSDTTLAAEATRLLDMMEPAAAAA